MSDSELDKLVCLERKSRCRKVTAVLRDSEDHQLWTRMVNENNERDVGWKFVEHM
jgi:hypothetical protein